MSRYPLVVDLDGTLVRTDMLHESALRILRDRPCDLLRFPVWLAAGKAVLKRHLAERVDIAPDTLPYNRELLDWLRQEHAAGRKLVLCTASDMHFATAIADHLGMFDTVMASDGVTNLSGARKAEALTQRFGQAGFDYAGNAEADLKVWLQARHAILVNASHALAERARALCLVERIFPPSVSGPRVWLRMLRVHQWLKNILLFVPVIAAHRFLQPDLIASLLVAFVAFSICASSVYVANDLLDLDSDRQHPSKCRRPFASGAIPAWVGVMLAPVLLAVSVLLAVPVGGSFLAWLFLYFALTCAYSWWLKRQMLIDCITLAVLYTLRILAGAAAADITLSFWLLAFSGFLFLSLAFVKRYAELQAQHLSGKDKVHGRGYLTSDAPLVQMLGIGGGYAAVVVLALYLNSEAVMRLYQAPAVMWLAIPVMMFWVSWMWMQAHRGRMHDDPLIFALKDRTSLMAGLAFAGVLLFGAIGRPW